MKLDKLREQAVAGRDAANMPDQYEQWSDVVETVDADDLELVIRAQTGRVPADVIRKYFASKAGQTQSGGATGGPQNLRAVPQLSERSRELELLVDAPFEELITFTKRWGNQSQLSRLRSYAVTRRFESGLGGDAGAGVASGAYWSRMATAAEAPLEDKFSAERQRFLWSQGPSTKELDDQSDKVNSLENQVNDLEQLLEELKQADGRTREERNTGEPPHPPWRRIEQVKQEIESIRDDLSVEKQLLKASEREKR